MPFSTPTTCKFMNLFQLIYARNFSYSDFLGYSGRYNGDIITDVEGFGAWCGAVAKEFKDNPNIIFDTNNEYHDMDQQLVFDLNQACIDGIRAAGATKQLILVEGNSWTGAWTW